MDFKQQLAHWNNGIFFGAKRRFAKAVGVSEAYVGKWVRGTIPGEELRQKVAKELGLTVDELMRLFPNPADAVAEPGPLYRNNLELVPVLGVVSAERFSFSYETLPEEYLPIPMEAGRKAYALRISGACMEPTFRDGDFVIISEHAQILDGRVVLAFYDGEYTLKRYYKKPDGIELRPDNTKFKTKTYASNKLVIKGVVVGSYRKQI